MNKFKDIDIVKQALKDSMDLNDLIRLADNRFTKETGIKCNEIEMVNEGLYKKQCDLDTHPKDTDGTRDSTASFTICPQKELFYCFGCGAGGDRFEYVSIRFNVSFIEAIEIVAEIEGIDLTPYYEELSANDIIINSLFKENSDAVDLAHAALLADERALAYLKGRGITDESIELFRLGYAPPIKGRISLFDSIPNRATLQLERVDQFNDAILFPITDVYGKARYFQSRPFSPMPGMKYIGGNDSHPLFEETDRIFGFNVIRKNLYKNGGKVVGVEGAPDTIACIQVGIPACGFLGTVCNQMTFDLLAKYRVNELTLLLDGDKAGRDKSFKICEKYLTIDTPVRLKVAMLPDGDPDEYINKFGADAIKDIIGSAPYAIQYLVDMKWNDARTPTEKMSFIGDIKKYMNLVTDKITKNIMYFDIAAKLGLDPTQVEDYYTQAMALVTGSSLFAPDGEEILLGEVIRNPDFIAELTMRFKDDDWYLAKHKYLFKIFKQSQYTDIESIYTIARNMNLDSIITIEWLTRIANKTGNIEFILKDIEDKLIRRKTIAIADKIKVSASDMSQDIEIALDRSTNEIYSTAHKGVDEQVFTAKHQVSSAMRLVHERMKNPNKIIGFSYGAGFQKLDMATLGLQKKTLTVVAANQSVGKCFIGDTRVMSDMGYIKISDMYHDAPYGLSEFDVIVPTPTGFKHTSHFWKEKDCTVRHIRLSNGTEMNGTYDHRIAANNEMTKMSDINIGDTININFSEFKYGISGDQEYAYCIGAYIGNGSCYNNEYWFHDQRPELIKRISKSLGSIACTGNILNEPNENCLRIHLGKMARIPKELRNCTAHSKHIPEQFFRLDTECRKAVIQGLLDTDGNITNTGFEFSTSSQQLKNDFVDMCRSVGIDHTVTEKHMSGYEHTYYRVFIKGVVNKVWDGGIKDNGWSGLLKHEKTTVVDIYETIEDVYDITVPDGHLFYAQGIINHNTQICQNWAISQSVIDRVPILWFSLEMDEDRMTFRNLSLLSGVPCTPIMTGNLTVEWKDKLDDSAILLEHAPYNLSDIGHDLSEALAVARRYVMKEHVEIIYIDYIQLQYVTDRKTNQRHQELGWISKAWKQFAKDMNVAIVLISQLSKEALKAETAEAEHGAGSYEIAQDADNYITLKEKSPEDIAKNGIDQGNIMMNVSKNRMGEKEILIPVYADRPIHKICEV